MDNNKIYETLLEKCPRQSKNIHHLNRYFKFIFSCSNDNTNHLEKHHILPKSMWPEYTNIKLHKWNSVSLTARQHFIAHWMLYKAFENKEMQIAIWFMSNTRSQGKITSRQYENMKKDFVILASGSMSKSMSGKTTYRDSEGNSYHISSDDPLIEELGLKHISTNKSVYRDELGNNYYLDINDPIIQSNKLKHVNLGRTMSEEQRITLLGKVCVVDNLGNYSKVNIDDPRYISGELQHVNKGTVNVVIDGVHKKVKTTDYIKGDFVHINKDKVDVIDKDGNVSKVSKFDPMYISGELKNHITDKLREKSRENMTKYNLSCRGSKWMTSPEGKTKNVNANDVINYQNEGWIFGRSGNYNRTVPNVGAKGRNWVNKDGVSKMIKSEELEDYINQGWRKGR